MTSRAVWLFARVFSVPKWDRGVPVVTEGGAEERPLRALQAW